MKGNDASLWELIPYKTKLSLYPLIGNAFLVSAGDCISSILFSIFCQDKSPVGQADVQALLLFANLCLALWVLNKILELEKREDEKLNIEPKILSLASAFLTISELFKMGVDMERGHIFIYSFFLIFCLMIVPFFSVRILNEKNRNFPLSSYLKGTISFSYYTVILTALSLIPLLLYFVFMNDGIDFPYNNAVPNGFTILKADLKKDFQKFWVINPAILSIAVLEYMTLRIGVTYQKASVKMKLDRSRFVKILVIIFLTNALLAYFAIGDDSLVYPENSENFTNLGVYKMYLGTVYSIMFLIPLFLLDRLWQIYDSKMKHIFNLILGLLLFSIFGWITGYIIAFSKISLISQFSDKKLLIAIHQIGFIITFVGVIAASKITQKMNPELTQPFTRNL